MEGPTDLSEIPAQCPEEFRGLDGPRTHELFALTQVWVLVSAADFAHPDEVDGLTDEEREMAAYYEADPAHVIQSLQGETVRGSEVPERAFLGRQMAADTLRSLEAGDPVLLGFGSFGVSTAISIGDSDVRFLGMCAEENFGPRLAEINDYLEANRSEEIGSRSERVIEFAADPDGMLLEATELIYGPVEPVE